MNHQGVLNPKIVTILLVLTTLAIAPWFALEPINAPKFWFMTAAGFFSIGAVMLRIKKLRNENLPSRIFLGIICSFLLANLTIFATSEIGWRQQLFGYLGRNTGLIFYVSVIFICILVYLQSDSKLETSIIRALHFTGAFSLFYALAQSMSLDPINWKNPYSSIIGFQGNPNFQSAFMGIYSVLLLHSSFDTSKKIRIRIFVSITLLMNIYIIVFSQSIQGLFVFLVGASVLVWNQLKLSRFQYLAIPYLVLGFVAATLSVFGLLKLGPLKFLYQPSVSFRGDYWRAGMQMFQDHPWLGLGHSSFGDYYMRYRDTKSLSGIDGRGVDTFSNSAHNVFIDILTSGGLFLFIPYLAVITLSLYYISAMRRTNSLQDRNLILFGSLWLAYLSQTLISVQFSTIAFWGWVFLAIFLKHSIKFESASFSKHISSRTIVRPKRSFSESTSPVVVIIFLIAGFIIGALPLRAGMIQKNAYESRRSDLIFSSAFNEPLDIDRMNQIALILAQNNRIEDAMRILDRAATITQNNSDTWKFIYRLSAPGSTKQQKARGILQTIDPYNSYLR